ncbi:MAG TPA: DUF4337 family protein [Candidatus Nitrosocosmicus sp.]
MNESKHKVDKFILFLSIFIISTSTLAIVSAIMSSHSTIEKNDLLHKSLVHLSNSVDRWDNYQSHKVREKIFQAQLDYFNTTLHQQTTPLNKHDQVMYSQMVSKYKSLLDKLYTNKSINNSLTNLNDAAMNENKSFNQFSNEFTQSSGSIELYDFTTILLIIGASLAGVAELASDKRLAISGFVVGGFGIIIFILSVLAPETTISLVS